MTLLDLASDTRIRTRFADGADTIDDAIAAAERAGLNHIAITDQVDARTDWIATYARSIDRARSRTQVRIDCGVATDILSADGALDLPDELPGVEHIAVLSRLFPMPGHAVAASAVRRLIDSGQLVRRDAMVHLIGAYVRALATAGERAQPVLARPFSLLGEAGISDADLDNDLLDEFANACRTAGAVVEVNERLVCPSPRVARRLASAGVRLVAASDSHNARDVGRWQYLRFVENVLPSMVPDAVAG